MENKNLAVLAAVAIIIFLIGGGLGAFYQNQNNFQKLLAIKQLSSKVVPSIVAYGKVSKIQGKNITLNFSGDSLTVLITDTAQIYSFASPANANTTQSNSQQKINFSDIKVGDSLNIGLRVSPAGVLSGTAVMVLPSFNLPALPK